MTTVIIMGCLLALVAGLCIHARRVEKAGLRREAAALDEVAHLWEGELGDERITLTLASTDPWDIHMFNTKVSVLRSMGYELRSIRPL